tara:strand:- start:3588 stop:3716 length:129 start_codon:yes stop_codon:yes gene_type:complete
LLAFETAKASCLFVIKLKIKKIDIDKNNNVTGLEKIFLKFII